ncbi:MAG TPA: hypothetical protein VGM88_16505 [Kofleriaceae bacterium]|jgi:HEAT repeat protein
MGNRTLVGLVALLLPAAALAAPARKKVDVKAAEAALAGTDLEAAAAAAADLGASDAPAAHDALLDALALGVPSAVIAPTLAGLSSHPAPPDVPALVRYAHHHNPAIRAVALAALATYPAPDAKAAVVLGLHDKIAIVRGAAAAAAAKGHVREAVDPLFELLALGEEPAARALAQMADAELVARIADHLGKVPDPSLALCLGLVLKRPDFGPDPARVEVVRAIGKIQDQAALSALTDYIDATPKSPPRPSRAEAERMVEARLGGGK